MNATAHRKSLNSLKSGHIFCMEICEDTKMKINPDDIFLKEIYSKKMNKCLEKGLSDQCLNCYNKDIEIKQLKTQIQEYMKYCNYLKMQLTEETKEKFLLENIDDNENDRSGKNNNILDTSESEQCDVETGEISEVKKQCQILHLSCKICKKYCYTELHLMKHMMNSHNSMTLAKCKMCKMYFPSDVSFKKHSKSKHSKKYHCKMCDENFDKIEALVEHFKVSHTEMIHIQKISECIMCDKTFDNENLVVKHLIAKHLNNQESVLQSMMYLKKPWWKFTSYKLYQNILHTHVPF